MKSRRFITPPRSSKHIIVAGTTGSPEGLHQADVRFGSKADIVARPADVRFTPESGHPELGSGDGCCDLRVPLPQVIALIAFQPKQYVSVINFSICLANSFKLELSGRLKSLNALPWYDCRAGIVSIW
jgi:hypothetical protein